MMIQKATAMKIAIASIMLTGIIETTNYTLAYLKPIVIL
jgi:hypothetical protein